jgi:ABC-2 type transport system permease protein
MWERILVMVRKEVNQVLRNPRLRTMLFVPPLIQLIIFGYAVNLDADNITMAWMDQDRTPASRELLAGFQGSQRFVLKALPRNEAEVESLLDRGEVQVVIRVLPGFARDVLRGRDTAAQILIDGTNSNSASLISSYASQIVGHYAASVAAAQQRPRVIAHAQSGTLNLRAAALTAQPRVWFNADMVSRNYFVPGVVANIIMIVTVMLTAMAVVREKEIGTMEQLMVTPIRPIELMIGKMLPFAFVGLMDMGIVTAGALLIFHVPFRGSFWLLMASALLFLLTSLGVGLFISTISNTQQQAIMSAFLFATPTFMLSGFAFPIRNMPVFIQYITYFDPLRYFLEIVRGIFLKGSGIATLWSQLSILAFYGVAIMGVSALSFRKKLD